MKITMGCRNCRYRASMTVNGMTTTTVLKIDRNRGRKGGMKRVLRMLMESKEGDERIFDVYRTVFQKEKK